MTERSGARKPKLGRSLLAGLAAGIIVLGIGGRLVMRSIALFTGEATSFSLGGTAQVLLIGAGWGALTGPIALLVGRRRNAGAWHGIASFLLAILVIILYASDQFLGGAPPRNLVVVGTIHFLVLFLVYGLLATYLLHGMGGDAHP